MTGSAVACGEDGPLVNLLPLLDREELAKLIADAKDVLEATKFMTGRGHERAAADADRSRPLLGEFVVEASAMTTAITTGSTWAVYGNFDTGYVIGDRLGMSFDLIAHLFGSNRRPTGERGAWAVWRNDGRVAVPNALRYGESSDPAQPPDATARALVAG